ncbi:28S ribosomal protein S9, mitochondrial [Chelonus insularis]|uniref:28S ribosomal protein S9, mitochondrial n=1 Tax=Chelonus insularis TaxID=460826 RepID=UPI00158E9DA8|nr:28S ribosomal protein S9, mitochondrial [Chelonus insularis]
MMFRMSYTILRQHFNGKKFDILARTSSNSSSVKQQQHVVPPNGLTQDMITVITEANEKKPKQKMSNAMKAYLKRAQEYDEFMKRENEEYLIGKRHLANMMGEDPNTFTQEDINNAIEYLFPSGLYAKAARPIMDAPERIFPPKKAAQFDHTGRPYHSLFYTMKPNFYSVLYDIVEKLETLNQYQDQQLRNGILPNEKSKFDTFGSDWLTQPILETKFLEPLKEKDYEMFIAALQRLIDHPYSSNVSNFIMEYRLKKSNFKDTLVIPPLEYDSTGRPFVEVKWAQKFLTTGSVKVLGNGSGQFKIGDGKDITFFKRKQHREQIIFPLIFTGMENSVDVEVSFDTAGGDSGYASLIRWGIAWALRSFVEPKMIEKMRIAGLLTRDWRKRERKKPGKEGKRRGFTWRKR